MKKIIIILAVILAQQTFAQQNKLLAPTPPMGWNSWNWFGKYGINEDLIKECIDAVVDEGLLDAGYEYFVIDGGWRDTKLSDNGELLPNPDRFPHGIKALADYAHSRGLKFGLHTVPGTHDCGGDAVGGFGNEEVQVRQLWIGGWILSNSTNANMQTAGTKSFYNKLTKSGKAFWKNQKGTLF